MLAAEGADPERVALHLLRTDPAASPETVAVLRAAAERSITRGAPESATTFLRRALAEPPLEPAIAADVHLVLALALAAHVQPDAGRLLQETVAPAPSPAQHVEIALRGGRALGLTGHFGDAADLCRRGLEHAADVAPQSIARLEAELVCNASLQADGVHEAHARPANPAVPLTTLELWRPNAAMWAMRLLADRARDELQAAGARPRRAALTGPQALTPAEHRVAHFAAEGHSNREIAEQLYVSRRTVETHLTHVFQKLDIRARAELPTALAERDTAGRAHALA